MFLSLNIVVIMLLFIDRSSRSYIHIVDVKIYCHRAVVMHTAKPEVAYVCVRVCVLATFKAIQIYNPPMYRKLENKTKTITSKRNLKSP